MYSAETEFAILKHALAPDAITGSKVFAINKANGSQDYLHKDFLVLEDLQQMLRW